MITWDFWAAGTIFAFCMFAAGIAIGEVLNERRREKVADPEVCCQDCPVYTRGE
jgi:hypothetical protein